MKVSKKDAERVIAGLTENVNKLRREVEAAGNDEELDISGICILCNERTGRVGTSVFGNNAEISSNLQHMAQKEFGVKVMLTELGMDIMREFMMKAAEIEAPEQLEEAKIMAAAMEAMAGADGEDEE